MADRSKRIGTYVVTTTGDERVRAFIPPPLPPEPTSNQAADTARQILALIEADRRKIEKVGRPAASMLRVHHFMQANPIISIPAAAGKLSISAPTVAKSIEHMRQLGMLREITGKQRRRLFVYQKYLESLNQGTEPLPD